METNKMETRDIFPLLMSMSLPMVLSMLVQSLYNIIDSIYVSYLGTGALTAVSLAFPLQNIVLSVAVGIGVGIASVLSISLGKKDQKRANDVVAGLQEKDCFEIAEAVNPGFINLKVKPSFAAAFLNEMAASEKLGVE